MKHCQKDLSEKLNHFYKRCVSTTVVKPHHFLRAKEGSLSSPYLLIMLYICNVQSIKSCVLVFYKLDGWHQVHSIIFLRVFAKRNLLAFGSKICGLKLKHCLKDLRIKLVHFYKRCVSITVVKPWHFLRAKDGSRKSPFLFKDRRGLANKEAKWIIPTIKCVSVLQNGQMTLGPFRIEQ